MDARLVFTVGRVVVARRNCWLYGSKRKAVQLDRQSNRHSARLRRWILEPVKPLPAAWEVETGNLSREHVRHKYKRPRCRS